MRTASLLRLCFTLLALFAFGIARGADSMVWTQRTSGTTKGLNHVLYANGAFVIDGGVDANAGGTGIVVLRSTDAVAWTKVFDAPGSTSSVYAGCGLAYVSSFGTYIAGGNWGKCLTSTDGITWTSGAFQSLIR